MTAAAAASAAMTAGGVWYQCYTRRKFLIINELYLNKKPMSDICQKACSTEMEHLLISLLCVVVLLSLGDEAAVINVNGALGKSVLFYVNYGVPANSLIQWNFIPPGGSVTLVGQYFAPSYTCSGPLTGRCEVFQNGSLRIDNVTNDDQGAYTLTTQVLAPPSAINTTNYQLKVYAPLTPPVLRTIVTSSPLTSGSNVTLQCDAGSQTVTIYTFYRDQKTICSQPNVICSGSFLNFTPIYVNDAGSYTCTIQNPLSSATSNSLTLTVVVPVSNINVTSNVSGLVWPGIDSVSLQCSALGTNVSYSWSLQGRTISTGTRFQLSADNSTLTISLVNTSDNGNFICTAKNLINNLNSSEVKLNLASPVSALTLISNTSGDLWAGQDSVSLFCSAQGSAITFSWRLNGEPVTSSPPYYITNSAQNSTLTISPSSKNDNGPFTCTASNRANNIISNGINLNINWFPDGNIQCSAPVINQLVQLNCSWPGGKPAANVTLIFNGTVKTGIDQVISSLTSSGNIHGSNLTCNGDQLGRTSSCVLLLEPPPSSPNSTIPPVTEGTAATMTVNLISGTQTRASTSSSQVLPAQFSWFNGTDNSAIQTGGKTTVTSTPYASTLKIDPVSTSDSGTYYCIATNIIGSTTYHFKVDVTKKDGGPSNGLDGGQIAGIVIGVLAGVAIIGIIVFFVLKKRSTKETIYENTDSLPANVYETRLPAAIGTEMTRKEESNYEQLINPEKSIYHTVIPGSGK